MLEIKDESQILWTVRFLMSQQRSYAVYGAGKFTVGLVEFLKYNNIQIPKVILDDNPSKSEISGIPVIKTEDAKKGMFDEIILGTDTFQEAMTRNLADKLPFPMSPINLFLLPQSPEQPSVETTNDTIENIKKLAALQNKHKGERAFVIGNGPSLRMEDLDRLKGEVTIATNRIYFAFENTSWRPTYYYADHEEVVSGEYKEINVMNNGTTKLFPTKIIKHAANIENPVFFNLEWEIFEPNKPKFSIDALDKLYWGSTVTYSALQLAAYMGVREIYLLGVDSKFVAPKGYESGDKRFAFTKEMLANHFSHKYNNVGDKVFPINAQRHQLAYQSAKETMESIGGNIFNATRGGELEIFKRKNFDDLFNKNGVNHAYNL